MPHRDAEDRRNYHRDYMRQRRAGNVKPSVKPVITAADRQNAETIRAMLFDALAEVRASNADVLQKARVLAYVAAIALKSVETASFEARLAAVEEAASQQGRQWA